jgi:hypothetical protein
MIDPSKIDFITDPGLSRTEEWEIGNELRQLSGDMIVNTLGISPELLVDPVPPKWSNPSHPQGEIVWYLRSGGDVYQVEKLPVPVLKGAGERTHRLWLNGNPMIGHQWCYSLEDAQWWAHWCAERDLKIQISLLKERVLDLESKLSRQRFTPQPY